MTRDEVKKLLAIMTTTFPNYKIENVEQTIGTWQMLLDEYDANEIFLAFKGFVKNNNSGFAPSVSQLINQLEQPKDLEITDDATALSKFRKALSRSTYYSQEEYDKLEPMIQMAVGSADMLHFWATQETDEISVIESNFLKSYRQVCARQKTYRRMPKELQARVEGFIEANTKAISDNALLLGNNAPCVIIDEHVTEDSSKYMNRLGELLNEN